MPDVTIAGWSICSSCANTFRRTPHFRGWFDTDKPYPGRRYGSLCAGCLCHIVQVTAPEWKEREERLERVVAPIADSLKVHMRHMADVPGCEWCAARTEPA